MSTAVPLPARTENVLLEDNPPNPVRLMEALRDMGYGSYESVMDLIDNSIDAGAKSVSVKIEKKKDDIEIVTDQERISIRFNDDYEVRTPSGIHRSDVCYEPALRQELEYWLRCIENGEQPSTITAQDGVEAVALAERVVAAGEASGPGNG